MSHVVGVVHRTMVGWGAEQGIVGFGHGKLALVASLRVGDKVIYYAPRTEPEGEPVQAFVAHATVTGEAPEERMLGMGHPGWVRAARYDPVPEVPIRPLLDRLEFLRGRGRNWGMALRGGRFSISEADYRLIAGAMGLG